MKHNSPFSSGQLALAGRAVLRAGIAGGNLRRPVRLLVAIFSLVLVGSLLSAGASPAGVVTVVGVDRGSGVGGDDSSTSGANVVFIVVDDADLSLMQYLPRTRALIADRGATFTHYYDSLPLCCPARTTYLRGQYTHNTGIWDNLWPNGGFGRFHLEEERSTLATWLSANQYQTALMGKYLNEYPNVRESPRHGVEPTYVPVGWSDWVAPVAGRAYDEFDYKLNINGQVDTHYRKRPNPANYLVDTISTLAGKYVRRHADDRYFLYLAPYAPHKPFVPAPRYEHDFPGLTYAHTPAFNEADVSDKPPWIAGLPRIHEKMVRAIDRDFRLRAQDMEGIDDLVQRVYDAVAASGQLDRTYFVFTSDNGFHMGEHREYPGKSTPYEEDVHLPLWIAGPGIAAGTTVSAVVGDIDLAPTIADLTGSPAPDFVDGHSVVPLLEGRPAPWRKYLVLERAPTDGGGGGGGGLLEPADPVPADSSSLPGYVGLHAKRFVYVAYDDALKTRELYDLDADPFELTNLLGPGSPGLTARQRKALNQMVTVLAHQQDLLL